MKALPVLLSSLAALVTLPVSAQQAGTGVKAPSLAEAPAKAEQGLSLTFTAGGKTDTRPARLVALFVPTGQPATPFLPAGPFKATWEGDFVSPLRATVNLEAKYVGKLRISLNGKPLLETAVKKANPGPESYFLANDVALNKGPNKFVVEYESPEKGDSIVRVNWSSKEFSSEPVPPMAFSHNVNVNSLREGVRTREGRLLFAQYHCTACHEGTGIVPPKGEGMPELAQDAPQFGEFGSRYHETWLAHWLNNPHDIRPRSLMPRVFPGNAKEGQIDQDAVDIAAYLASLGKPNDAQPDETHVPAGAALFANLGCIACHQTPEHQGEDEYNRVPLNHLKAKWQAPALQAYLKDPQALYQWTRMPNFRLTDEEAAQLTAYLLSGNQREFAPGPKGDAVRGAQLAISVGCLNCHAGVPPMTTPKLADTLKSGWEKGCMAPDEASRGKAPNFALTKAQREALLAFAANGFDSLKQDTPVEFAQRQIRNLNCTACHPHDGQSSTWSSLEGEMAPLQAGAPQPEGEGVAVASTAAPLLTWFGEKLQPDWSAKFIAGGITYKPRPWIIGRMPGFGVRSEILAHGLALDHGYSPTHEPAPKVDPEHAKAGETLISENGGFNCTTCHGVGERPPTAVFEAPGINLAYSTERLRHDYYLRWVLNPPRIDPDTKMPKFADETGKTPLTEHFDGDAVKQYEAIWQYLHSLKK
ncbi:c-type cytochrome [Verrucomicrobiota bacterium sgz303538]